MGGDTPPFSKVRISIALGNDLSMSSFISSDRHVSRCFSVCFAPAARQLAKTGEREAAEEGRKKVLRHNAAFLILFFPSLPPFLPRDIYKSLRFHTKKESLGSRESHESCLRPRLSVFGINRKLWCVLFSLLTLALVFFCSSFMLKVFLLLSP